jgi:hypothetical protein
MSHFPAKFSKIVIRRAEKKSALFAFYFIFREAAFWPLFYWKSTVENAEIAEKAIQVIFQKRLPLRTRRWIFNWLRITAMSPQLV